MILQCIAVQYSAVQYTTVRNSSVLEIIVQYSRVRLVNYSLSQADNVFGRIKEETRSQPNLLVVGKIDNAPYSKTLIPADIRHFAVIRRTEYCLFHCIFVHFRHIYKCMSHTYICNYT